jgi:hypothetical protein
VSEELLSTLLIAGRIAFIAARRASRNLAALRWQQSFLCWLEDEETGPLRAAKHHQGKI